MEAGFVQGEKRGRGGAAILVKGGGWFFGGGSRMEAGFVQGEGLLYRRRWW